MATILSRPQCVYPEMLIPVAYYDLTEQHSDYWTYIKIIMVWKMHDTYTSLRIGLPSALQRCHNEHSGIPNHQHLDRLLDRFFRCRSKKTSEICVTGLCVGNSPVTGEFPTQRASNTENVSIWWRHHGPWKIPVVYYVLDRTTLRLLNFEEISMACEMHDTYTSLRIKLPSVW